MLTQVPALLAKEKELAITLAIAWYNAGVQQEFLNRFEDPSIS